MEWANSQVTDQQITGFGDKSMSTSHFLCKVEHAVNPNAVNFELLTEGVEEEDAEANAKYAIGIARKLGCFIFCAWDDITTVNKKMMLIFIASLFDKSGSK